MKARGKVAKNKNKQNRVCWQPEISKTDNYINFIYIEHVKNLVQD